MPAARERASDRTPGVQGFRALGLGVEGLGFWGLGFWVTKVRFGFFRFRNGLGRWACRMVWGLGLEGLKGLCLARQCCSV